MNTNTRIAELALEQLKKHTQITGVWRGDASNEHKGIDGEITFHLDDQVITISAGIKRSLRSHQLYEIKETAVLRKPFLVVAEHIFPKIKEELKKNEIAYLEANGNVYLKEPGIYLWIESQKPVKQVKENVNRAFTKTGLRVILQFLLNEEVVNQPYRNIAELASIGLGNVTNVMNGLKQAGFLLKMNKGAYKLVNKKELLDKWRTGYEEKLKPTLHIGNFRFINEDAQKNWKDLPIAPGKTCWGSEPAADILTNHLKPEIFTLYTKESRSELIKRYRLIPDENGKVQVYTKLWSQNNEQDITVDPLLIYADLMNTGDGRCIEIAKKLFDKYEIAGKF